jgi:hypothetical protein
MSSNLSLRCRGFTIVGAALFAAATMGPGAGAQTLKTPSGLQRDPIRCWWRTDQTAIVVGEHFKLTLTCSLLEVSEIKAAVNRDSLEPRALQLTPFEVVSGERHEDILSAPWRYFQNVYEVRLLGSDFFGQDVNLPSIGITYRVVSNANETAGQEQTLLLPPLPMRVISLVPREAHDIRDDWSSAFGAIEARRFRGTGELVAGSISVGFAVVLFGAALVRGLMKSRASKHRQAATLPVGAVLRGCAAAIRQLRRDVQRDGWNPDRVAQALAALRVAAAVALGRPVAQVPVGPDVSAREGQVLVKAGVLRPTRMAVSAATGERAIDRQVETAAGKRPVRWIRLDQIGQSLRVFSTARYSRNETLDTTELDAALERAEQAVSRLRLGYSWPARVTGGVAKPVATGGPAWFR